MASSPNTHHGTYSAVSAANPLNLAFLCGPDGDSRDCYAGIAIIVMIVLLSAPAIVLIGTCYACCDPFGTRQTQGSLAMLFGIGEERRANASGHS